MREMQGTQKYQDDLRVEPMAKCPVEGRGPVSACLDTFPSSAPGDHFGFFCKSRNQKVKGRKARMT